MPAMDVSEAGRGPRATYSWMVVRRRKAMEDPMFLEGNALRSLSTILLPPMTRSSEQSSPPIQISGEIMCQIGQCRKTFTSVADYEMHHSVFHRNICCHCKRRFPNYHLLDLHVLESHDSMFTIQSQTTSLFSCLVPTCCEKLRTHAERQRHTVDGHRYPANFRFESSRGTKGSSHNKSIVDGKSAAMESDKSSKLEEEKKSNISDSGRRFVYNVPKNICFGQGSQRGFGRGSRPARGRGRGRRNQQHDVPMATS